MINLKLKEYCSECSEFEPEVIKDIIDTYELVDHERCSTTIKCKHDDRCQNMFEWIKRETIEFDIE